ncbi:MAG TPA: ROK family protein [Pseudonocardia sp.]|nr:ROK family protein [Pseudonocardia sp.]
MREPSLLPPLRLAHTTPDGAARLDAATNRAITLSTLARLVASGAAVSKADLVAAAGLARSTVSTGVDELLARGVLQLDGTRPTPGRGRPADRLALNPRGGFVLVADLGARGAHLAVVDLSQRMHAHTHVDIDVADGPDAVLDTVESELASLRASVRGGGPVRAAVIGVPGPVDGRRGVPVRPPIMPGWHGYPVTTRLRRTFGCPVQLENDVNLRALGEARALPEDQSPLLFVKVGTGIGGGLITQAGALHHGADGAAGDIGHIRVRGAPETRCVCGNVGCIEAVASAAAIARRLGEVTASGVGGSAAPGTATAGTAGSGTATIDDVRALVSRGDPTAVGLVREAAGLIGEVVATLVHFYNPARVTIGGSVAAASDELLAGIRAVVYQVALPLATRNLVLANSVLGKYAGVAGATVLGIEEALSADGIGVLMART